MNKEKTTALKASVACAALFFGALAIAPDTELFGGGEDDPIKREWNANYYQVDNGSTDIVYGQGWLNYKDVDKEWKDIDTTLIEGEDFFTMDKAPFSVKIPKLSTGTASFISNNRWDEDNKADIQTPPLTMALTAQGVDEVEAKIETGDFGFGEVDYVVYKNAYPQINADLIYWVQSVPNPELKKIIRINEDPKVSEDLKFCFDTDYDDSIDLKEGQDQEPKEGKIITEDSIEVTPNGEDGPRKIVIEKAFVWSKWHSEIQEENEDAILIPDDKEEITLEVDGASLCKIIKKSYLDFSEYPVYSDASFSFTPSPGTADGYAYWGSLAGETWTTARNQNPGTSWNNTDVTMPFGIYSNAATNEYENFWRSKAIFDTSSLDDSAVINSTQISGNISFAINNFDDKLGISAATTASNTAVAFGDFPVANCGATPFSGGVAMVAGDFSENLNAAGVASISKTGYTKFCFNSLRDIINSEPTWVADRGGYGYLGTSEGTGITLTVNVGPSKSSKKVINFL